MSVINNVDKLPLLQTQKGQKYPGEFFHAKMDAEAVSVTSLKLPLPENKTVRMSEMLHPNQINKKRYVQ
jgi:hypothetical protein